MEATISVYVNGHYSYALSASEELIRVVAYLDLSITYTTHSPSSSALGCGMVIPLSKSSSKPFCIAISFRNSELNPVSSIARSSNSLVLFGIVIFVRLDLYHCLPYSQGIILIFVYLLFMFDNGRLNE